MKATIKGTKLKLKEILVIIERLFKKHGITEITNMSLYFNSSDKRVVETTIHKHDLDMEERAAEDIDKFSF